MREWQTRRIPTYIIREASLKVYQPYLNREIQYKPPKYQGKPYYSNPENPNDSISTVYKYTKTNEMVTEE